MTSYSNHQRLDCLLNRFFRRRSKKTPKLCVTGLCEGNVTGGFPSERASDAENVYIWWRHHILLLIEHCVWNHSQWHSHTPRPHPFPHTCMQETCCTMRLVAGVIFCMGSANQWHRYSITSSLIGRTHSYQEWDTIRSLIWYISTGNI